MKPVKISALKLTFKIEETIYIKTGICVSLSLFNFNAIPWRERMK